MYKVIRQSCGSETYRQSESLQEWLNTMEKDGWLLISVAHLDAESMHSYGVNMYIFWRLK